MSRSLYPVSRPRFSDDGETRNLRHEATAGIRRRPKAIARPATHLEIAQRFLIEGRRASRLTADAVPARRALPARDSFAHALNNLRRLLARVGCASR